MLICFVPAQDALPGCTGAGTSRAQAPAHLCLVNFGKGVMKEALEDGYRMKLLKIEEIQARG